MMLDNKRSVVDYEQQMDIKNIAIGSAREDGKVLAQRRKGNKGWWVTPEKFEEIKIKAKKRNKKHRENNREYHLLRCQKWRDENKEENRQKNRDRYNANKEKYQASHREWMKANRDKINSYRRKKRRESLQHRISENLRAGFKQALAAQLKSSFTSNASFVYLGCSFKELKTQLEDGFQEGMSWDNYGDWHIDHIKPLCMHDLSVKSEQAAACHHTNLQPLWADQNSSKGGRWIG